MIFIIAKILFCNISLCAKLIKKLFHKEKQKHYCYEKEK